MYLEGLRNEGIVNDGTEPEQNPISSPDRKPQGPQQVDVNRLAQRTITLSEVNWGAPPQ